MNHKGTKTIETERLILRQFKPEDAQAMFDNWASEDEVSKWLPWPTHENVEVTKWILSDWIPKYENPDYYKWAIELKSTGKIIGDISIVRVYEHIAGGELGYCLGSKWWGNGIMPEAGKAVIKFLFEEVGFNRIQANYFSNNQKSGRVMQKIGMTYEGTKRQAGMSKQGISDMVEYAILKEDYNGQY
ncbi:MAG: GNAT family N-acetyltransferase [Lachnospiraceae bacterium]|nr:GNAT family N-acetyltransferase [Lachnospiraceae bacterium]